MSSDLARKLGSSALLIFGKIILLTSKTRELEPISDEPGGYVQSDEADVRVLSLPYS